MTKATQKRQSFIKDAGLFAGASYLATAINVVNGILLRSFILPGSMGIWSFLQVLLGYSKYATLGTGPALVPGANRRRSCTTLRGSDGNPDGLIVSRWRTIEGLITCGLRLAQPALSSQCDVFGTDNRLHKHTMRRSLIGKKLHHS